MMSRSSLMKCVDCFDVSFFTCEGGPYMSANENTKGGQRPWAYTESQEAEGRL